MKATVISIILAGILIGGAIIYANKIRQPATLTDQSNQPNINNVSIVDGKQIIDITARGGYSPRITMAKADMPTVIRMSTKGSFDCSSAVSIPSLGYRANLPPTGTTDIEIGVQKSGSTLQGLCAMGMYNFQIKFN
ncbi:MAG: hypothetical protein ACYC1K_01560 [Minisyncoccota bacterium]